MTVQELYDYAKKMNMENKPLTVSVVFGEDWYDRDSYDIDDLLEVYKDDIDICISILDY